MARPKKEGLDYFPVDVNFDEKIESIIMMHEHGLAWVIRFWQKAYKTMEGVVDFNGLFAELFANKCKITLEEHQKILNTAIMVSFCYETKPGVYTSNGIKKRISTVSKERDSAIKRLERNTNKEKKSKEKKSKVKDCPSYSANNLNGWRLRCNTFENYKLWELEEYEKIKSNSYWISEREKYHPKINILLTLEKAHSDFWSTKAGWKKIKSRKTQEIDWVATWANAVSMRGNQVWKNKNNNGNTSGYQYQEYDRL